VRNCFDCQSPHHKRGDPNCPKRKKGGQGGNKSHKKNNEKGKDKCPLCGKVGHTLEQCFYNGKTQTRSANINLMMKVAILILLKLLH